MSGSEETKETYMHDLHVHYTPHALLPMCLQQIKLAIYVIAC